jgi:hypothetical protein
MLWRLALKPKVTQAHRIQRRAAHLGGRVFGAPCQTPVTSSTGWKVAEISNQRESEWAAISEVARPLGLSTAEKVRKWCATPKSLLNYGLGRM